MRINTVINPTRALLAGKSLTGNVVVELSDTDVAQLSETQRQELARHAHGYLAESGFQLTELAEPTLPEIIRRLDELIIERKRTEESQAQFARERAARDEKVRIENEEKAKKIAALEFRPDLFALGEFPSCGQFAMRSVGRREIAYLDPQGGEYLYIDRDSPLGRQIQAHARQLEDDREAKEAALDQSKTDYINDWIDEHADAETQQQNADGLLARADALRLIADALFDSLTLGAPRADYYVCDCDSHECGVQDTEALPRGEVYRTARAIRSKLPPNSTIEYCRVTPCTWDDSDDGYSDDDGLGNRFYIAKITVPCGPFKFNFELDLSAQSA